MAKSLTWVGLSEAARILGAHPATVRSWADRGDLPSQRTPGGHRRFRRSDLVEWMARQGSPSIVEAQLLVQSAMGRARVEIGGGHLAQITWYQSLDEQARAAMAAHGRQLMDAFQRFLSAPDGNLDEARSIGLQYGKIIRGYGLSLAQTVEGFFTFNDFLLDAMLQVTEISRSNAAQFEAMRKIYAFTRTIILALIEAFQEL